jgi:hypothetical protein
MGLSDLSGCNRSSYSSYVVAFTVGSHGSARLAAVLTARLVLHFRVRRLVRFGMLHRR